MHIVGIGLANIDLVAYISDEFLTEFNLEKGQAKKLSKERFAELRSELSDIRVEAGGCAGNTMSGLYGSDVRATFLGKIGNDEYADIYKQSFIDHHVAFPVLPANKESSQCAVLVTPDGERTFAYMRGASWTLSAEDVDMDIITSSNLVYTEIYAMAFGTRTGLWPTLVNHMRSFKKTMALKTIDKEYADLYGTALFGLAEEGILSLLIGNADNLCALAKRETISEALDVLSNWRCAVLLTDGKRGAYYNKADQRYFREAQTIDSPLNTSGAGDQFAAGFIEYWIHDKPIDDCLANGESKAHEIIMRDTPRV